MFILGDMFPRFNAGAATGEATGEATGGATGGAIGEFSWY